MIVFIFVKTLFTFGEIAHGERGALKFHSMINS